MSRNKMPFVAPELLKRVEAMNEKHGQELQQYIHKWLDTQSLFMMVENMYQFI